MTQPPRLYVASRASVPDRPAMWRYLRAGGWNIVSSWIDEACLDETVTSMPVLWRRIEDEVRNADALILYVEPDDLPIKGALVEVGMALALGKPVAVVYIGYPPVCPRTFRPLGSWVAHPQCALFSNMRQARLWIGCRLLSERLAQTGDAG